MPTREDEIAEQARIVRGLREDAGLTQEQCAALVGVTQSEWSRWECGSRLARRGFLARVQQALAPYRGRGAQVRRAREERRAATLRTLSTEETLSEPDWLAIERAANGDSGLGP